MLQQDSTLRIQDLLAYKPGDYIPASVFMAEHWTDTDPADIAYGGRLQTCMQFIENYFRCDVDNPVKVLCRQANYGVLITVGEEASSTLSTRAINKINGLRKIKDQMITNVDLRYMTIAERRRHENRERHLALQLQYLDKAELEVKQANGAKKINITQKEAAYKTD